MTESQLINGIYSKPNYKITYSRKHSIRRNTKEFPGLKIWDITNCLFSLSWIKKIGFSLNANCIKGVLGLQVDVIFVYTIVSLMNTSSSLVLSPNLRGIFFVGDNSINVQASSL